jgi:hypothetical protein
MYSRRVEKGYHQGRCCSLKSFASCGCRAITSWGIDNLGKAMKCKYFLSLMCSSSDWHLLITSLLNVDACLDGKAEAYRVNTHLRVA